MRKSRENKIKSDLSEIDKKLADCFCFANKFYDLFFLTKRNPKIWFSNWWNRSIKDTCSFSCMASKTKLSCCTKCGFPNPSCLSISRTFSPSVDVWSCLVQSVTRHSGPGPEAAHFFHYPHTMLTLIIKTNIHDYTRTEEMSWQKFKFQRNHTHGYKNASKHTK